MEVNAATIFGQKQMINFIRNENWDHRNEHWDHRECHFEGEEDDDRECGNLAPEGQLFSRGGEEALIRLREIGGTGRWDGSGTNRSLALSP